MSGVKAPQSSYIRPEQTLKPTELQPQDDDARSLCPSTPSRTDARSAGVPSPPRAPANLGSEATQQAREHVRALASLPLSDPRAGVHLGLVLNSILRRLDELEAK